MPHLHLGVVLGNLVDHLPPQLGGVQHVGLVHGAQALAPLHGGVEAHLDDAADLMLLIGHQVGGGLFAVFAPGFVLAEIGAADELPDHDKVDAPVHDIGAQGTGILQLRDQLGRPQVGVQLHARPQSQQALFRPELGVDGVPLGAADGRQKGAVAVQTGFQAAVRQGNAEGVDGTAAHGGLGVSKGVAKLFGCGIQSQQGLVHDLRADAVAPDQRDLTVHFAAPLSFRELSRPPLLMMPSMNGGKGAAW